MKLSEDKIKEVKKMIMNDEIEEISSEDLAEFNQYSIEEIRNAMSEIDNLPDSAEKQAAKDKLGVLTLFKKPIQQKENELNPYVEGAIRVLDFGPGLLRQAVQGTVSELIDPAAQSFAEDTGRAMVGLSPTAAERMQRLGVPEMGRVDLAKYLPEGLKTLTGIEEGGLLDVSGRGALGTALDVATGGLGLGKVLRGLSKDASKQYASIFQKLSKDGLKTPQDLKQIIERAQTPKSMLQSLASGAATTIDVLESPLATTLKSARKGQFSRANIPSELAPKIPASAVADEYKIAGSASEMFRKFNDVAKSQSEIQNRIAKAVGKQVTISYKQTIKPVIQGLKDLGKTQGLESEIKPIIKEIKNRTQSFKKAGVASPADVNELKKGLQKLAQDAYKQSTSPIASPVAKTAEGVTQQLRQNTYEKLASRLRQSVEDALESIDPRLAADFKASGEIASAAKNAADEFKAMAGQTFKQEIANEPGRVIRSTIPGLGLSSAIGIAANPVVGLPIATAVGLSGVGLASRPLATRLGLAAQGLDKYAVATGPASRMAVQAAQEEINPMFNWNALIEEQRKRGYRP